MGVPYIPIVGLVGTHLLERRDDMVIAPDPFGRDFKTVVAKALRPDFALFHVQKADPQGNVSCGYHAEAVILAEASRQVIVTAEEVVERLDEKEAAGTYIPGILVDTVVHAPFGAHPAACPGVYGVDKAHMARYVEASRDDASFAAYLEQTVFSLAGHDEYIERHVPREWRRPLRAAGD
jgi:glutaconate CoA-transferase subunit A